MVPSLKGDSLVTAGLQHTRTGERPFVRDNKQLHLFYVVASEVFLSALMCISMSTPIKNNRDCPPASLSDTGS